MKTLSVALSQAPKTQNVCAEKILGILQSIPNPSLQKINKLSLREVKFWWFLTLQQFNILSFLSNCSLFVTTWIIPLSILLKKKDSY